MARKTTEQSDSVDKKSLTTEKEQKNLEKIKINAILRGSYGSFNPGEIVEIEKTLAASFIKGGYAQKVE